MHMNTRYIEDMLKHTRRFTVIMSIVSSIFGFGIPLIISKFTDMDSKLVWVISLIISTATTNGLSKVINNLCVSAYNDEAEHDAYILQQSLKKGGLCDIDKGELDKAIKILQTIRDAEPPTEEKKS